MNVRIRESTVLHYYLFDAVEIAYDTPQVNDLHYWYKYVY